MKDIEEFDPYIDYYLGKEDSIQQNNKNIFDIKYTNRYLEDVIIIDSDLETMNYPESIIIIPKFEGDDRDKELIYLFPLLRKIAKDESNVRDFIKKFGNEDTHWKYLKTLIPVEGMIKFYPEIVI